MASTYCDMSGLHNKIKAAKDLKKKIYRPAADYFKSITPIKTGNARSNTHLNNDRIEANYPYASILDAGRRGNKGSNQAPDGMTKPTVKYIKTLVQQYISQIGRKK